MNVSVVPLCGVPHKCPQETFIVSVVQRQISGREQSYQRLGGASIYGICIIAGGSRPLGYRPSPVRRVTIPKPGDGERELGIPTVTDRLIQQALLQVLQPILDLTFSEHSYGFRPGRRAHDAVLAAQSYVQSCRRIVVDVDLEKYFDRGNDEALFDRLHRQLRLGRLPARCLETQLFDFRTCRRPLNLACPRHPAVGIP